jgi:hypothetical protein
MNGFRRVMTATGMVIAMLVAMAVPGAAAPVNKHMASDTLVCDGQETTMTYNRNARNSLAFVAGQVSIQVGGEITGGTETFYVCDEEVGSLDVEPGQFTGHPSRQAVTRTCEGTFTFSFDTVIDEELAELLGLPEESDLLGETATVMVELEAVLTYTEPGRRRS